MKHRPAFLALTALSLYFGLPVALSVAADQAAPEPSMAGAPAAQVAQAQQPAPQFIDLDYADRIVIKRT